MNDGAFCLPGSFLCVDALAIDLPLTRCFGYRVSCFVLNSGLWLPVIVSKLGALATGIFFENQNITIKTSISTTRKREI
jgi:hypothetical protein